MQILGQTRRPLTFGLVLSAAVHAGLGVVAGITPSATSSGGATAPAEMELLPLPDDLRLGIEESGANAESWIGFADQTEHQARQSEVEQSAMTPDPAGAEPAPSSLAIQPSQPEEPLVMEPRPVAEPAEAVPSPDEPVVSTPPDEPAPSESPRNDPAPEEPSPEEPKPEELVPAEAPPEAAPPKEPELLEPVETALDAEDLIRTAAAAVTTAAEAAADAVAELLARLPALRPPPPAPPESAPPAVEVPSEAAPASAPAPPGTGGEFQGERSPSEAAATSLREPIEVRPGRVIAAQGLQITTVRPQYSMSTMVTARPRSPVVEIHFGRDGRVVRASFLPGRTTGDAGVDQPLLDAIYRWTASGAALASLGEGSEDVISVTMRILMR